MRSRKFWVPVCKVMDCLGTNKESVHTENQYSLNVRVQGLVLGYRYRSRILIHAVVYVSKHGDK